MKFYCGIDLSARDCHVCVIDEQLKIVVQQKLRNELPKICQLTCWRAYTIRSGRTTDCVKTLAGVLA